MMQNDHTVIRILYTVYVLYIRFDIYIYKRSFKMKMANCYTCKTSGMKNALLTKNLITLPIDFKTYLASNI